MSLISPPGRRQTALRTYSRRNQRGAVRKPSTVAAEQNLSETSRNVTASTRMPTSQPDVRSAAITSRPPKRRSIGAAASTAAEAGSRASRIKTQSSAIDNDDAAADLSQSTAIEEADQIVSWNFNRATKSVDLVTYRASDGSKRLVQESVLQQKAPQKVYAYWLSFDQPREVTIGSHYFHIFDILDQKGSKLKVQWVGYTDSADDTTWETAAKVRKMNPDLLADYMAHHERARSTGVTSKPRKGRVSGTAIG
ncbi:hypothetical protein LX32DRAFT_640247 [Colletotrichum zoysiae]|uniref:Chromo domain-containing protein n=1 Tax=Colletotrichum zoysiae TaxID=1216348 RepID=A0AAD9HG21_9PEZI|nr:hypothetical protein LX32DRAFT_640247 [Colletotrichum zoysiae]